MSDYMTKKDICDSMRISIDTFDRMRRRGDYPPPDECLSKRTLRWLRSTHERFKNGEWAKAA